MSSDRALACRPVESEARLAYAALADLLADVPDAAMSGVPAPQQRPLEVALLRAEPEGEQSRPRWLLALVRPGSSVSAERPGLSPIRTTPGRLAESRGLRGRPLRGIVVPLRRLARALISMG
jgi:hypothetical protein